MDSIPISRAMLLPTVILQAFQLWSQMPNHVHHLKPTVRQFESAVHNLQLSEFDRINLTSLLCNLKALYFHLCTIIFLSLKGVYILLRRTLGLCLNFIFSCFPWEFCLPISHLLASSSSVYKLISPILKKQNLSNFSLTLLPVGLFSVVLFLHLWNLKYKSVFMNCLYSLILKHTACVLTILSFFNPATAIATLCQQTCQILAITLQISHQLGHSILHHKSLSSIWHWDHFFLHQTFHSLVHKTWQSLGFISSSSLSNFFGSFFRTSIWALLLMSFFIPCCLFALSPLNSTTLMASVFISIWMNSKTVFIVPVGFSS